MKEEKVKKKKNMKKLRRRRKKRILSPKLGSNSSIAEKSKEYNRFALEAFSTGLAFLGNIIKKKNLNSNF